MMLETLDCTSLEALADKLGVVSKGTPAPILVGKLANISWSWGSTKTCIFCEHFGIADVVDSYVMLAASGDDQDEAVSSVFGRPLDDPFYELHTFQSDIRDRVLNQFIVHGEQKLLLQLPTGGGKTRVALHTAIRYLRAHEGDRVGILWLAYDPLLLSQAAATFQKLWPVLGVGDIEVRRIFDIYRDPIHCSGPVIYFASVQSLTNRFDVATRQHLKESLLITVFDEAHQIVANQAKEIINNLLYHNDELRLLGLTATPGRDYFDDEANVQFRKYFSTNIKIEPPPKVASFGAVDVVADDDRTAITYLQELGVLAQLEHRLLDYGMSDQRGHSVSITQDCYRPAALKKLGEDPSRNRHIVDEVDKLVAQGKKTLVFACSVQHAEDLSFFLRLRGINVGLVLGNNREHRSATINRFRKTQDLHVLINFGVLTTGFDAPEIDAVVISRPTSSLVTYSQMLGRALRGPMNGGHVRNLVVNVSDPIFGKENEAYKKFETYWRDYA
ncbi:MAG: DEAD/DEAH box helicase family protein [Kiritimatiellaeota bacterium]|nr:DEAD/DEAH box helicase family protein [Kiritimatiellota bacterium]